MAQRNIVDITDLEVKFYTYAGVVEALDGVNISIKEGEILGLVGETGCGKSVTSLSIMRLVPPPGKVEGGKIVFSSPTKQQEIMTMDESSLRGMRGKDISMIFQEPRAYLNPVYTVENQIAEVMHVHRKNELLQNSIDSIRKRLVEKRARSRQQRAGKKPEERPKRLGFRGSGQKLRLQTRIASIEKKEVDLRKQMLDMEKQGVDLEKQKATKKQKVRLQRRKMKLEHLLSNLGYRKSDLQERIDGVPSNYEVRLYKRMIRARSRRARLVTRVLARFNRKRQFAAETRKEVVHVLKSVEIPDPERVAGMYPHELSGGMAQRVVIAMALACNPRLLIADEPTTNLDVTVQAQILNLIKILKKNLGSSILYITHDLGVVAQSCDRVAVMYAGNVVETADVFEIFKSPLHPYTAALLESIPKPGKAFKSIPGIVPSLINPLPGCRFHDRCSYTMEKCLNVKPLFTEVKPEHFVSCHLYGGSK